MILQALKNMYPKASEKVLRAVMTDLEKCRATVLQSFPSLPTSVIAKDDSSPT